MRHLQQRPKTLATMLATVSVLAAACGTEAEMPDAPSTAPPAGVQGVGCLDETRSTASDFNEGVREAMAAAIDSWYPSGDDLVAGRPATAALRLTLFPVTSATTRFDVKPLVVVLPELEGLPPLPTEGEGINRWSLQKARWVKDRAAAQDHAAAKAQALRNHTFASPDGSGVLSCLSAAAQFAADLPDVRFAIFSDLDDTTSGAVGGRIEGPVTVVQPCPSGDLAKCGDLFERFAEVAAELGATEIETADAKDLTKAVDLWLSANGS